MKTFYIAIDACSERVGDVLMSEGLLFAYLSKTLPLKQLCLSIYENEMLVLAYAIDMWQHSLFWRHFIVKIKSWEDKQEYVAFIDKLNLGAKRTFPKGEWSIE